MPNSDREILRRLAERYMAICSKPEMPERRDLWRRHNSLQRTRPPIYTRAFAWREMPDSECRCQDPFYRQHENVLRQRIFWDSLDDDSIFEPWITVNAVRETPSGGVWGVPLKWIPSDDPRGAKQMDPPLKQPEDFARMVSPHHIVDEARTQEHASKLHDAVGDIIEIDIDRAPVYRTWNGDISTRLAQLRGLDQVLYDMMDRPEWLHKLLAFMRDGIRTTHEEAERAGHWTLGCHQNQAMPYAEELDDPVANGASVKRDRLWYFCASQEYGMVGPALFEEFMLRYQMPIIDKFALVAYGCCEDLTQMVPLLRSIPNLRRIAVSPMADVAKCAEQIGTDYVLSYRPSPSDMVGYSFDEERIRRVLREDFAACGDCHFDITLKDVETVQHDPTRVRRWVEITREMIEECL